MHFFINSAMDGEFFIHENIVLGGGHAMNIVGFNDYHTTKNGFTGGRF